MTERFTTLLAHVCLTYRKTILAIIAGLTALTAPHIPDAVFDNSMEAWFLRTNPDLVRHRAMTNTYGNDEYILIGLEAPDVFAPDVLDKVRRITNGVREAPHVEKVFSLTTMEAVGGHAFGIEVEDLIPSPLDPDTIPSIRERALSNPLYVGTVVDAAGTFTTVSARLPFRPESVSYKFESLTAIRTIVEKEWGPRYVLAGGPAMDEALQRMSERDTELVSGLMTAALIVILWVLLRSLVGVAVPTVTVGVATIWAMGWVLLCGVRLTAVSQALPPMMLAVGVADSMHILVAYQQGCWGGKDKRTALRDVYRELTWPCFLTSLTTVIGMLSLCVSEIKAIREFGFFAAVGVFGAFLLSMTLCPIALSYLPAPAPRPRSEVRHRIAFRWLERTYLLNRHWSRWIMATTLVLLVVSLYGITRIKTTSGQLSYYKKDSTISRDTRKIESMLAGTTSLAVVVDSGQSDGIKDPRALKFIAGLEEYLRGLPEVTHTQSVNDLLRDLRRAFFDGDEAAYRLPETREEAAQYILLYEMSEPEGDIYEYVNYDYREGRVTASVTSESSTATAQVVEATRRYIATMLPSDFEAVVSGSALMWANMDVYLRSSLLRGFSIALLAIFAVMCVQLRSAALGAIAMVPNVGPILFCLGVMGLFGIPLDTSSTMVASITLGLAVDNTVHLVARTRYWLNRGHSLEKALHWSTQDIGRAIAFTSFVLVVAFVAMLLAEFNGMNRFGGLCAMTLLVALPSDLLVLPILLRWYAKVWRKDWVIEEAPDAAGTPAYGVGVAE